MILGLIQARMGSTRCPGKTLREVAGKPLLWHVIHRLRAAKKLDKIGIATTTNPLDDRIEALGKEEGIPVFRGSEMDILDRLYQSSKQWNASAIVRVTADCPLVDPALVDGLIEFYLKNADRFDCVSNVHPPSFPNGLDLEIIPFKTLEAAWKETTDPFEREWAMKYIFENPSRFRVGNLAHTENLSHLRWTVDHEEDVVLAQEIFSSLQGAQHVFHMDEVLQLINKRPELTKINSMYSRNHAYQAALQQRETTQR